jgi:hypothetical protein
LREAIRQQETGASDRLAIGTVVQSFYNGVENILVVISEHLDKAPPGDSDRRHKILPAMSQSADNRPAVISPQMRQRLQEYLHFAESFRYGHFFQLRSDDAQSLAVNCPAVLGEFENELSDFFTAVGLEALSSSKSEALPPYWTFPARPAKARLVKTAYVLAGGLVILFGLWAGIGISQWLLNPPESQIEVSYELIRPYLQLAVLPEIPGTGRAPGQFLPDERWTFRIEQGAMKDDSLSGFSGHVTGMLYPYPQVHMQFENGRIISMIAGAHVYRFSDGRLSRYEINPDRSGDPQEMFHEIWQLSPEGKIIHLSTWADRQWKPVWLGEQDKPFSAGRWDFFWAEDELILTIQSTMAGSPRQIRVLSGDKVTVFDYSSATVEITTEGAE